MKVILNRLKTDDKGTIGFLKIDNDPMYFTLEDPHHDDKTYGDTRIPMGSYEIKLRNEGGMTKRYKDKYGAEHKGMLWLQDVPGYEWIYIHTGNTKEHTEGCILVGMIADISPETKSVGRSRDAYKEIYGKIRDTILSGEKVIIQVIDE
jgi:Family of unknown function (DUF5675)